MKKLARLSRKKGFTLIELSLSVVFISVILLTIAFLTIFIIQTYEKGVVVKDITASGRELIDDFSRSISMSSSRFATEYCGIKYHSNNTALKACKKDNAFLFTYQQRTGAIYIKDELHEHVPLSGIFCTGSYSYMWNTGYALNSDDYRPQTAGAVVKTSLVVQSSPTSAGKTYEDFRLIKFMDPDRQLCQASVRDDAYAPNLGDTSFSMLTSAEVEELLDNNESGLVFYDFTIFHPTQHELTNQTFYSGTFTLGTTYGNINIMGSGDYCATDDNTYGDLFEYCAINKFNFSMRSTGQKLI